MVVGEQRMACLTYIKDHMAEVVELPSYLEMMTAWPELMRMVSRFMTGAPEVSGDAAADTWSRGSGRDP